MKEFKHPLDPSQKAIGRTIEAGEVLHSTDLYDAPNGKWGTIPHALVGSTVTAERDATFVRPVS